MTRFNSTLWNQSTWAEPGEPGCRSSGIAEVRLRTNTCCPFKPCTNPCFDKPAEQQQRAQQWHHRYEPTVATAIILQESHLSCPKWHKK